MSISEFAARLSGWPRRLLALGCVLLAAVTAMGTRHEPPPAAAGSVVVAARDLPAGAQLTGSDVRVLAWPVNLRPPGAISRPAQVIGRRLAGPIRADEALTGTRLAGADLTAGLPPELRAVPVELAGSAMPDLVRVGDRIDLLVNDQQDGDATPSPSAHVLAEGVRVLAVAGRPPDPGADGESTGLIVAADQQTALRIAAASGRSVLATVRKPP
ncbi:MAG TPA: Flp pilus assembly protein CpaB [Jatrophihabitantaceae bacterium]